MLGSSSSGLLLVVEDLDMVFRLRSPLVGTRNMCFKSTSLLVDAMARDVWFVIRRNGTRCAMDNRGEPKPR